MIASQRPYKSYVLNIFLNRSVFIVTPKTKHRCFTWNP